MKWPKKLRLPTRPELVTQDNRRNGILIVLLLLAVPGFLYGGLPFALAYAATVGMYILCQWLMPPIARPMFISFSFHAGLMVFRLVGLVSLLLEGTFPWSLWLEMLFALLVLVWLMWKPGMWAASLLMIFDALTFIATFDTGTILAWPILLLRIIWPIVALLSMFLGLYKLQVFSIPLPYARKRKPDMSKMVLKAPVRKVVGQGENQELRNDPVSEKRRKRNK